MDDNQETAEPEIPKPAAGRIKLYLGYAAGVGKTYTMLAEAHRRRAEHAQDVVVGFVDAHHRPDTEAQIGDLEVIPRRSIGYRGHFFDEMDVERIIRRAPQWVVVDDMAHANVPGSRHPHRYDDIAELTEHGIGVLTTLNVHHIESLNDTVTQITGVHVRDTVPDWVVRDVDEIVTVDLSPRALLNRLKRGDIFQSDKVPLALANFFTEGNLSALRELTLREVARAADNSVQKYREQRGISDPWRTTEKVMVCLSPTQPSDRLLRRGWRIANIHHCDLVAVLVTGREPSPQQKKTIDAATALAGQLNIRVEEITGKDIAGALADYAHKNQVTEIVIGHPRMSRLARMTRGSIATDLIGMAAGIDVLVIAIPDAPQKAGQAA